MPGLFTRLKTWLQDEKLTSTDLNAEFNNILTNSQADKLKGHSDTLTQMQTTENPAPGGVPSTGTTISTADELERIRYQFEAILGGSKKWYESPVASIDTINTLINSGSTNPPSVVLTGKVGTYQQPVYLQAKGSGASVDVLGTATDLAYQVDGTPCSIITDTNLALAVAVSDTSTLSGNLAKGVQDFTLAAPVAAATGRFHTLKVVNGGDTEYMFAFLHSSTVVRHSLRGFFFDSSSAAITEKTLAAGNTVTVLKTHWIFAKSDLTVTSTTNQPSVASVAPSGPSNGDYWYDLANNTWKTYNGASWVVANACLIGLAACDTTNCVVARSADFYKSFSDIADMKLVLKSSTEVYSECGFNISVYGSNLRSPLGSPANLKWIMPTNIFSGESEGASKKYFIYVGIDGATYLSEVIPLDRRYDLKGWYHPHYPLRCFGYAYNDGSSNFSRVQHNIMDPYSANSATYTNATSSYTTVVSKVHRCDGGVQMLALVPDPANVAELSVRDASATASDMAIKVTRYSAIGTSAQVSLVSVAVGGASGALKLSSCGGVFLGFDYPGAGEYTYVVEAAGDLGGSVVNAYYMTLVIQEISRK